MKNECRVLGAECKLRCACGECVPRSSHSALSTQHRAAVVAVLVLLLPVIASACPVCFGSPDDPLVKGANRGIWVLLGFIAFVQIGFIAMFWSFWRRARAQKRFRESLRVIDGGGMH